MKEAEARVKALEADVQCKDEALHSTLPRLRGELYADHPELLKVEAALAPQEKI